MNNQRSTAFVVLLACTALAFACAGLFDEGSRPQEVTRNALIEEIDFLVAKIEEAHADPYRLISKPDFHKLADQLQAGIVRAESDSFSPLESYFLLQELAAAIQDEHTEMVFPYDAMPESELYLPFHIGVIEEKLINVQSLGDATIPKYAELLEINGVPAKSIWAECRKYLNSPLPHAKADLFAKYLPFYLTSLLDLHSPWTIHYRASKPGSRAITTEGITREELEKRTVRSRQYRTYTLQVGSHDVPVLDIPSFSYGTFDDYKRFIDDFFANNKNEEALVIDLRRNPGGNGTWGYYMLDFLGDSRYRIIDEFIFKMSDVFLKSGYRNKASKDLSGFGMGEYIPIAMESLRSPHRSADKFTGRVFLLISHATDSAGVVTAAVFKHNKMGVTIGQETAGRIRFCSDPVSVRLPRTGLRIFIPLAIYGLPGATPDRGVAPDIEVPYTIESLRNDEDPEIAELREILAK